MDKNSSINCVQACNKIAWFNSTVTNGEFKEGHDARWLIQRINNLFLLKNNTKFKTPVGFAHIAAMSRVGLDKQMSEAETTTKTKTETRPRL